MDWNWTVPQAQLERLLVLYHSQGLDRTSCILTTVKPLNENPDLFVTSAPFLTEDDIPDLVPAVFFVD